MDENEIDNVSNSDTSENNNSKPKKVTKHIQIGDIRLSKHKGQRELDYLNTKDKESIQ